MLYGMLKINFEDNRQLTVIVIGIVVVAVVALLIVAKVLKTLDKRRERRNAAAEDKLKYHKVLDQVEKREKMAFEKPQKEVHQVKRESRDPNKRAEEEAASKNTLLGGKSEAQREEREAIEVFGPLGISSRKSKDLDRERERIIVNGYLQKSNTAPIRPVYSNTLEARQQQRKELDSDEVGAEAETPAMVMDSAAPSSVRITGAPQKVRPRAMKKESPFKRALAAAQAAEANGKAVDETYTGAIRPELGSEVSNAVVDRVAEVQEEKPDIMKSGEEAILPAAEKPLEGFAPNPETDGND